MDQQVKNRESDMPVAERWLTKHGYVVDYPKNYRENLEYRSNILKRAEASEGFQLAVIERCRRDIWYFFNTILWTPDPRRDVKSLPFITYEYQDEYIWELENAYKTSHDLLTEKSRDMGASMLMLGFLLYHWFFEDRFSALLGSYIEDLVDNKTIDSHFGRLDYFLDHMPKWFKPTGFDESKHRNSMKLENPKNSSIINGYAPTERFSRAGRYNCIFADEFAFWKHARAAWNAMGDATKIRFVTSTPNGKGNKYSDLALKGNIKKVVLLWNRHPLKTQEWYEKEKTRRTEEEIAQELDINYNKSISGRVYPEFDEWNFNEKQEYDPKEPLFISWDFGLADQTAMVWIQVSKDGTARIIDTYQNSGKIIDFYVPFVTGEMKSLRRLPYSEDELEMIERHKGWQDAIHYGDPTGDNEHQTSKTSVIKQLRVLGINVNFKRGVDFTFKMRHTATKLLMRRLKCDKDQLEFIDAIQNARFPQKSDLSQSTNEIVKPVHDWTSHYRTALEFYAVNEDLRRAGQKIVDKVKDATEDWFDNFLKLRPKSQEDKLKRGNRYKTCA